MTTISDNEVSVNTFPITRKKVKLLVINENKSFFDEVISQSEMISHVFDYECRYANTNEQALELMSDWRPTAALLDLSPTNTIDIFPLLERWKGGWCDLMVMGEHDSVELQRMLASFGATEYFCKDETLDELFAVLEKIGFLANEVQEVH